LGRSHRAVAGVALRPGIGFHAAVFQPSTGITMLEQNEYLVTWAVYYGAALGVLLVWWRMTKPIPWVPLKQLLRVLLAAAVLVPAPVDSQSVELAPALFVLLFDLLLIQEGDALRASVYLLYGVVLGLVALIIDGLIRMVWRRARANA